MPANKRPPRNGIPTVVNMQKFRVKADEFIKNNNLSPDKNLKIDSTQQLLHELQIHQIELEMQNEELRQAYVALDIVRTRYFDLYDLAPIGYLTLNEYCLIQQANLTVANLLGMHRSELIKQPLSKLILNTDQDVFYLNHKKLFKSNEPQSFDLQMIKNDHTTFWANLVIKVSGSNISNDQNVPELLVLLSDITERKKAEQEVHSAWLIAEKANRAKSEFLSNMTHELRTPLNAILGFAQLMDSGIPLLTITQKKNIDQILKAGWYLLDLIDKILDLAVIDSGKVLLNIESISLINILSETAEILELQATKRGVNILLTRSDVPYFVKADYVRLKQVLLNLLLNAIKYNKPSGSVTISYIEKNNQRIRICIEDTGIGLTVESIAQLFQNFNRLGKEFTKEEGTGIGLVLSKKIVELMGGSIGVDSTVGKGSVFWIELNLSDDDL